MSETADHALRATAHRRNVLWLAALTHRLSGLALVLFLPLHFLVLGLALEGEAALHSAIVWTRIPVVKISEAVLIFLLVAHLLGGMRILVIENLPWRNNQTVQAVIVIGVAILLAALYLLRIF